MVNYMPVEPRPTDEAEREWLLKRLDFIRSLIESGAPCGFEDRMADAHDRRRLTMPGFVFYDADWIAHHRARRAG